MKKVISIVISICIVFSSLAFASLTANAETFGDFEYYIKSNGTVEITEYTGKGGDVIIPAEINGKKVTEISDGLFADYVIVISVTIPGSIENISNSAFWRCSSLKSVTINNGVKTIDKYAFYFCYSLTSITIPDSVTSIGESAFKECNSLESVIIGNGVENIGDGAFNDCDSLKSITLGDNIKTIGYGAFWYSPIETMYFSCVAVGIKNYCISNNYNYTIIHSYSDWIFKGDLPNCGKNKFRTCEKCGDTQYEKIAHNMTKWKVVKKPTYFKAGKKTQKCTNCNLVKTKKIAKLKLATPTITKIKKCNLNGKNGKVTFKKVKDATYYEVWDYQFIYWVKSGDAYAHCCKWKLRKTTKKTACKLVNYHPGVSPKVKIRAVYKKGKKVVYSKFSEARHF